MTVLLLCRFATEQMERAVAHPALTVATAFPAADDPLARAVLGVVVRSENRVDAAALDRLPNLQFVLRAGSGTDNLDIPLLVARGVEIVRHPSVAADAVAELASTALTALARRMPIATALLARGHWGKWELVGDDVASLRAVVWGAGPIGLAVGKWLERVCEDVRFARWPSVPDTLPTVATDEAMASADVHLLCLPLRASTVGLFGREAFDRMADRMPYLINIGRLEVMDLASAVERARLGLLRGVFVDPIDEEDVAFVVPLLEGEPANVLLTPHLGAQRADIGAVTMDWVIREVERRLG